MATETEAILSTIAIYDLQATNRLNSGDLILVTTKDTNDNRISKKFTYSNALNQLIDDLSSSYQEIGSYANKTQVDNKFDQVDEQITNLTNDINSINETLEEKTDKSSLISSTYGNIDFDGQFIYYIKQKNGNIIDCKYHVPPTKEDGKGGVINGKLFDEKPISTIIDDNSTTCIQLTAQTDSMFNITAKIVEDSSKSATTQIWICNVSEDEIQTEYLYGQWNNIEVFDGISSINYESISIPLKKDTIIKLKRSDNSAFLAGTEFITSQFLLYGTLTEDVVKDLVHTISANYTDDEGDDETKYVYKVIETNGKIEVKHRSLPTYNDEIEENMYVARVSQDEYGKISVEKKQFEDEQKTTLTLADVYPVGSIYMTLNSDEISETTTLSAFASIGKWKKIAFGQCLFGADKNNKYGDYELGQSVDSGLPSISNTKVTLNGFSTSSSGQHEHEYSSENKSIAGTYRLGDNDGGGTYTGKTSSAGEHTHTITGTGTITFSNSDIFGKSDVVQPPALVVNIWQRIS